MTCKHIIDEEEQTTVCFDLVTALTCLDNIHQLF